MADNVKITTEDVVEILDTKIKTNSAHGPLDVSGGEFYDSVLAKIAERTPTFDEKAALVNAESPSGVNPFTTLSHLNRELDGRIPWKSIGPMGSGADYQGSDQLPFQAALDAGARWLLVRPGTYTFTETLVLPDGTYLLGSNRTSTQITASLTTPVLTVGAQVIIAQISITQTLDDATAILAEGDNFTLEQSGIASTPTGKTIDLASGRTGILCFSSRFDGGSLFGSTATDGTIYECTFDTPGVFAVYLDAPLRWNVVGCNFKNGQFRTEAAQNLRIVGNHFNDGVFNDFPVQDEVGSTTVLVRANTPNASNNEIDDFTNLLQYIGSSSVQQNTPVYSNNYAGPAGENLTARAGALDLLLQWRYEERNFQLVADSEPFTVQWNPVTHRVATTGPMRLVSSHREAYWILPQLGAYTNRVYATQETNSTSLTYAGGSAYVGQSFLSPYEGTITTVSLQLSRSAGATGAVELALYRVDGATGLPTGSPLGVSPSLSLETLDTTTATVTFTFASPIDVTAGSYYAIALRCVSLFSSGGTISLGATNTPGAYSLGTVVSSANGGASWSSVAGQDLTFTISGRSLLTITLQDGYALYYKLDRSLLSSNISLTPYIDPVGSIANNSTNRQVYVLAYRLGDTLWWRGGGGSRFPGTGGQTGTYYIDGSSKSLVDYLGAVDFNDYDPSYSNNFAGIEAESLTVRLQKHDNLLRTLYEYTNVLTELPDDGYLGFDSDQLNLSSTLTFNFPHNAGKVTVSPTSWTLNDGQILYLTWDQSTLSSSASQAASAAVVTNGSLPLPNDYPNRTKYFAVARRKGSAVYLWDDTELIAGGRWPQPIGFGRQVIPTATPTTLTDNIVWTGTDLLWEKLALVTSTGLPLTRNDFTDQTTVNASLTTLGLGQGLLVTHTWNPGANQSVTIERVSLPISRLKQNQFLWVQNVGGSLVFGT